MGEGDDVYASVSKKEVQHIVGFLGYSSQGVDYRREKEHLRNSPECVSQLPNIVYFEYLFIFYNNYAFYL